MKQTKAMKEFTKNWEERCLNEDLTQRSKTSLIEFVEFIRKNYTKGYLRMYLGYEEWQRGN